MRCRVLSHGFLFVHLLFRYNNLYVFCDFFKNISNFFIYSCGYGVPSFITLISISRSLKSRPLCLLPLKKIIKKKRKEKKGPLCLQNLWSQSNYKSLVKK